MFAEIFKEYFKYISLYLLMKYVTKPMIFSIFTTCFHCFNKNAERYQTYFSEKEKWEREKLYLWGIKKYNKAYFWNEACLTIECHRVNTVQYF